MCPVELLANELNALFHGQLTTGGSAPPRRDQHKHKPAKPTKPSDPNTALNYGFDFDPANDGGEDVFNIADVSLSELSESNNAHEEEKKMQTHEKPRPRPQPHPHPRQYPTSNQPAKWTPDDATDSCERCHKEFTWYRWRYHCRMCGRILCQNCSPHTDYVAGYRDDKVRTCEDCHVVKEDIKKKAKQVTSIFSGNFLGQEQSQSSAET